MSSFCVFGFQNPKLFHSILHSLLDTLLWSFVLWSHLSIVLSKTVITRLCYINRKAQNLYQVDIYTVVPVMSGPWRLIGNREEMEKFKNHHQWQDCEQKTLRISVLNCFDSVPWHKMPRSWNLHDFNKWAHIHFNGGEEIKELVLKVKSGSTHLELVLCCKDFTHNTANKKYPWADATSDVTRF